MTGTIVVTGANGYIGKKLVASLEKEDLKVVKINRIKSQDSNEEYSFKELINGLIPFENYKIEFAINLGIIYERNYLQTNLNNVIDANIKLPLFLLNYAIKNKFPVILPGSHIQERKSTSQNPLNEYTAMKNFVENYSKYLKIKNNLGVIFTRQQEIYGLSDTRNKLIYRLIDGFLKNETIEAPKEDFEINFLHVDDLILAYLEIFKNSKNIQKFGIDPLNIQGPDTLSYYSLIKLIKEKIKKTNSKIEYVEFEYKAIQENLLRDTQVLSGWMPTLKLNDFIDYIIDERKCMVR
jgi:nucleoside-diphosphate-sugar epimerase